MYEWSDFNDYTLPSKADAIWHLPSGEYAYAHFEIRTVEYNVAGN